MSKARIRELRSEIERLQAEIDGFEADPEDFSEQYDDMLDEMGDVEIGGLSYAPSHVLKRVDAIAYRTGLLDYVDSLERDGLPEVEALQEELEDAQSELEDLEEEMIG